MTTKRLVPLLEKELGPLTFGLFLQAARVSLGITQAEMARKLGLSRGVLCDIEKGRQLVSTSLAVRVAKKAGLSEDLAVKACLQDQVNKVNLRRRVELVA